MQRELDSIKAKLREFTEKYKLAKGHSILLEDAYNKIDQVQFGKSERDLVIFDLNGIFIERKYEKDRNVKIEGATRSGNFLVWIRPDTKEFLDWCFKYFDVAVWSSVKRYNIDSMLDLIFGDRVDDLKFIWDQSHCQEIKPTAEEIEKSDKYLKSVFLKNLKDVWEMFPQYDESNTLLIDDSDEKSVNNPEHCHYNPGTWDKLDENDILMNGHIYGTLYMRVSVKLSKTGEKCIEVDE